MATATYTTMRGDFATVLDEWKNEVTITRTTNTLGSMGEVISTSTESYTIKCIVQPIRSSDRDIHSMGLAEPGNKKAFFKHEYDSDDDSDISGTFTPAKGDTITDSNSVVWRIVEIMSDPENQDNIVFLKTVIRRLE